MDEYRGIIEGEKWELIFDNFYAVSNYGRVMRTANQRWSVRCGVILTPRISTKGYLRVAIHFNGLRIDKTIHDLVAAAFIGIRSSGIQVNHKNGNKANNFSSNLEYATPSENQHHAREFGLNPCKLSEADLESIRSDLGAGILQRDVAAKHGCSQQHVSKISTGKRRSIKWSSQ